MSDLERLMAAAAMRTSVVRIGKEEFIVREVAADTFGEYALRLEKNREDAIAYLLERCVVDASGATYLSAADAAKVARVARVGLRLINGILAASGYGDEDKKEPDAT